MRPTGLCRPRRGRVHGRKTLSNGGVQVAFVHVQITAVNSVFSSVCILITAKRILQAVPIRTLIIGAVHNDRHVARNVVGRRGSAAASEVIRGKAVHADIVQPDDWIVAQNAGSDGTWKVLLCPGHKLRALERRSLFAGRTERAQSFDRGKEEGFVFDDRAAECSADVVLFEGSITHRGIGEMR